MTATVSSAEVLAQAQAIIEEYSADKMNLRQLYYQLVARLVIPNNIGQYKRLSSILVKARENGDIAWDALEDRTRSIKGSPSIGDGDDAEEAARDVIRYIKWADGPSLPTWWHQDHYVEVWLEKEALGGVFESVTGPLSVVLMPGKGYSSATFLKEAADRLREVHEDNPNRVIHILYFGDYDPSGLDIERYAEEKLRLHGVDYDTFDRVCLTRAQIDEYNLPPMPVKASDSRSEAFRMAHGDEVVELDALPVNVLKDLIREAVEQYFDQGIGKVRRQVQSERRAEYKVALRAMLLELAEEWASEDEDQED